MVRIINGKYVLIVFKVDYKDINRINYYENEEELGYEFKKIRVTCDSREDILVEIFEKVDYLFIDDVCMEKEFKIFRSDLSDKSEKCRTCDSCEFCHGGAHHSWDYDRNEQRVCFKEILF